MKHTIHGFQQEKLLELGLDNDDALILSVIRDMYSSQSIESTIIDDKRYIWLNQTNLITEQIPICGKRRKLLSKLEKFEELNLINRKMKFEKLNVKTGEIVKGKFSYVTITERMDYLIEYDLVQKSHNPCAKNAQPLVQKSHNKDSPIKDSNNIYSQVIDYLNSKAGKSFKHTTKKTQDLIKARLADGFKKEEFFRVIDNKVREWQGTEYEKYLRPETLFGNKFEGYLNQGVNKKSYEERKGNSSKDSFDY